MPGPISPDKMAKYVSEKDDSIAWSLESIKRLTTRFKNGTGPILSKSKEKKMRKELEKLGYSDDAFEKFLAVVAENTTVALFRLLRNLLYQQIRLGHKSLEKKPQEMRKKLSAFLKKIGFEDAVVSEDVPWLMSLDAHIFLNKIGSGVFNGHIWMYNGALTLEVVIGEGGLTETFPPITLTD